MARSSPGLIGAKVPTGRRSEQDGSVRIARPVPQCLVDQPFAPGMLPRNPEPTRRTTRKAGQEVIPFSFQSRRMVTCRGAWSDGPCGSSFGRPDVELSRNAHCIPHALADGRRHCKSQVSVVSFVAELTHWRDSTVKKSLKKTPGPGPGASKQGGFTSGRRRGHRPPSDSEEPEFWRNTRRIQSLHFSRAMQRFPSPKGGCRHAVDACPAVIQALNHVIPLSHWKPNAMSREPTRAPMHQSRLKSRLTATAMVAGVGAEYIPRHCVAIRSMVAPRGLRRLVEFC